MDADGTVVDENFVARTTLGSGVGQLCWDFVGNLPHAEGLPCNAGCVAKMLAAPEGARRIRVRIDGRNYWLTCMAAADERVACTLHRTEHEDARTHEDLTPRERQVIEGIAAGETTSELAARLSISASTVRSYVEHIRNKLGVSTRAAMVARALRLGLID